MSGKILEELLDTLQNEDNRQRMEDVPREKRYRSIDRDTAEFISVLARVSYARNILEIGSSVGYSTIWLGLVAKSLNGKVTSFETDLQRFEQANANITKADLTERVIIYNKDPRLNSDLIPNDIDLVFLDAEKEDYVDHFNKFFDKLKPGGIIIADNIVSHFADVREYVEMVRNHEKCNSVLVSSIGKGIEITYKMREEESEDWNTLVR